MHCPRSVCSRLVLPIKMSKLSVTDLGFRSPKLDKRNNYEQGGKSCLSQRWACCHLLLNQRKSGTADTFSGSRPWKCKSQRFSNLTQCNGLLCFRFAVPYVFFKGKGMNFKQFSSNQNVYLDFWYVCSKTGLVWLKRWRKKTYLQEARILPAAALWHESRGQ